MSQTLNIIKQKSLPVLKRYAVKKASIFGSYARGQEKKSSDIDMLVEFGEGKNLFDLIGLRQELKYILGKRIDVNTYRALNRYLKNRILREQKRIL